VVIPSHENIRALITSADVLHSWALPSLGVKIDAVPGRLNQFVFRVILIIIGVVGYFMVFALIRKSYSSSIVADHLVERV
jgi:hypothetical protein